MALQHENGSDLDPNPIGVETHAAEGEKLGTLGGAVPIEEGVEKISLVGASLSIQGNGENNDSESQNETESDSENENAESDCPSASDSSSGSSSSSSSSDSEDEEEARHDGDAEVEEGEISGSDKEKMVSWSMVDDDNIEHDDEDDDDAGGPIRSKNELQNLPPVPSVDAALEPQHQMRSVGIVTSIIGAQVIVEGVEKHDPLNEGSILWLTESRKPLGLVDEIFGPVKNPFYVVRYNSESEVPAGIHGGTLISFVPEFADHVLSNKDLYKKGYDASGANDEELSDEIEFSDDEKEAEYKRMQRTTKRGANDQNHGKKKNNRKKFPPKEHVTPTISDAPAVTLLDHGNCAPFSGIGQGFLGGTTTVPSFPPINTAPNFATNGVWTNGTILPQQPQPALLPNGFPSNGISWYPQNTQISAQLPMPGIPFQQQLHSSQGPLSTPMLPGVQPNIFAQPIFAPGLVGQNQMTFGLNSPFPPIQPPICAAQQGFPPIELHSERNLNLHSNAISGAPSQFHPGSSVNRGRKTFHGAGRKGWRPAK
ncbi:H/ACA ribonucleoprotein complex non-core subunit NAF1-like [Abrus precatorius]|uniref:H/ACA ribonucleoprotein complex non-core subunit NAF1 n=1 Tax=Abrus precatorius TaxID=3816 RepID=A0A8B8KTA1_ABRPR|nr:H/ACA ribonucleoprotein complex non-core subunit NAF1-like [Abrus precatorius]